MAPGDQLRRSDLRALLIAAFGEQAPGRPDMQKAAAALGLSPDTVRRWVPLHSAPKQQPRPETLAQIESIIAGPSGRRRPRWPGVTPATLAQEAEAAAYAVEACRRIANPSGRQVLPVWRTQGWLNTHAVPLLHQPRAKLWRVALSKNERRPLADLDRTGDLVDRVLVPHRFAAVLVKQGTLDAVRDWRVEVPRSVVPRGPTDVWPTKGPQVDLHVISAEQARYWS